MPEKTIERFGTWTVEQGKTRFGGVILKPGAGFAHSSVARRVPSGASSGSIVIDCVPGGDHSSHSHAKGSEVKPR
jgi:hypothetical protein